MKHTPGPWHYEYDDYQGDGITQAIRNDKGSTVCGRAIPDDARLIAAAPELLGELKAALRIFERDQVKARPEQYARIRAAISKAEERKP